MSDPLCMSLDDIIKQKKTKNVLGVRGRGTGARVNAKVKVIASPAGRVSRNFKGKLTNSLRNKKTNPKRRGGGSIYFNSKKNASTRRQRNPGNAAGGARISPQRRQLNRATAKPFAFQPQYQSGPVFPRRRRQQGVSVIQRAVPLRSIRNPNWQGQFRFARKSVYRARQQLIRSKILQDVGIRRQGQYFGTGRILVGKYGLVTTQRQNITQRQTMMRRKIQRARQIRENRQNTPMGNFAFNAAAPGRRQQRLLRNQNVAASWATRPTTSSSGQVSRNYSRQRRAGGYSDEDDAWIPPLMTIRNSGHDTRIKQQPRHRASSGLDPNIQRKIQYIQQQGRRNRSNEVDHGHMHSHSSGSCMPVEEEPTDFQPTIISSRMSLSDRFKRFMN